MFWEVGLDAQPLYLLCIILSLAAEVDTGRNQGAAAEADVYGRAAAELNAIREQQAEMSTIESSWVWPHEMSAHQRWYRIRLRQSMGYSRLMQMWSRR